MSERTGQADEARDAAAQAAESADPDTTMPETSAPESDAPTIAAIAEDGEPAAPAPRRALNRWLVLLLVFLLGVSLWPLVGPRIEALLPAAWQNPLAARLTEVEARLAAVEGTLATVAARPAVNPDRIATLETRLDERAQVAAGLESRLAAVPAVDADAIESRLAALEAAVTAPAVPAALLDRIAVLEARPPTVTADGAPDTAADPALTARLAALEAAMRERGDSAAAPPSEAVAALVERAALLEQRLVALEARPTAAATAGEVGAVLARVGQLRNAVATGAPYLIDLNALASLDAAGEEAPAAAITALRPFAADGVPTVAGLRVRLSAIAGAVVRAEGAAGEDTWWRRTADRMASLVSVRRTGALPGDGAEAIVARAELHLQAGALAVALDAMRRLGGAPADAAKPWLDAAEARLAADRAMAELEAYAIALAAAG